MLPPVIYLSTYLSIGREAILAFPPTDVYLSVDRERGRRSEYD
jgi:hypothetical protein